MFGSIGVGLGNILMEKLKKIANKNENYTEKHQKKAHTNSYYFILFPVNPANGLRHYSFLKFGPGFCNLDFRVQTWEYHP